MRISDVSEKMDISVDTLRYYDRVGLLTPINRTASGIRDYAEIDIKRVGFIKCIRKAGLPIEVLTEYFKLVQQGDQTVETRKNILLDQRERLISRINELQETLDFLNFKIDLYEKSVLKRENEIIQIDD